MPQVGVSELVDSPRKTLPNSEEWIGDREGGGAREEEGGETGVGM